MVRWRFALTTTAADGHQDCRRQHNKALQWDDHEGAFRMVRESTMLNLIHCRDCNRIDLQCDFHKYFSAR